MLLRFNFLVRTAVFVIALLIFNNMNLDSQTKKLFTQKGIFELGGEIGFSSAKEKSYRDSYNQFFFNPSIGYFAVDGLELGLQPISYITTGSGDATSKTFLSFASIAYHINANSFYPYLQGLFGFASVKYDGYYSSSSSGLGYGLSAGLKFPMGGNGLLNLGVQYLV